MNGSKTDHISKNSKNCQKKLHFYIEKFVLQMTSKCMVCNFFVLRELKNKVNNQLHVQDGFYANHLTENFLSKYLSRGTKAGFRKQSLVVHFLDFKFNNFHRWSKL